MAGESELRRIFYLLGCLALVGAILYWARPVMIPLTIAVLTTFILAPMVSRLERWGVPRVLACTTTLVGAGLLLVAIGQVFVQQMGPLTSEIPAYKAQVTEKIGEMRKAAADSWVVGVLDFANDLGNAPAKEKPAPEQKDQMIARKVEIPVATVVQSIAGMAAEFLLDAVLVFVMAFMMLIRREDLRNRMIQLLGSSNRVTATRALDDASKRVSRFLFFQLLLNLAFGTVVAVALYFIGIPYAYIWGALAAVLRYIPFLGGWISAAFPLLMSLIMPTWTPFFLTATFFVIAELLQANLVEPLVFGHSIGVSGPGQVVAMLFWALLWGPVGLILSTPLTACLCVVGHHFPGLRFFATLMGDGEIIEKPDAFYQRLLAGDSDQASVLAEGFLKETSLATLVDEMLIPALLASRIDLRNGELTKEDQISIAEAVREIYFELAPQHESADGDPSAMEERHTTILVMEFPFNDEIDNVVMDMLRNAIQPKKVRWMTETIGNGPLDQLADRQAFDPTLILISTSAKKNLARIRGAGRTVTKWFPHAETLVCCWCLESESDANFPHVKDTPISAVCTTFLHAQQLIEAIATVECPNRSPVAVTA